MFAWWRGNRDKEATYAVTSKQDMAVRRVEAVTDELCQNASELRRLVKTLRDHEEDERHERS